MSDKGREKSKEGIVNSFNKYLLSALYVPGIALHVWSSSVKNTQDPVLMEPMLEQGKTG